MDKVFQDESMMLQSWIMLNQGGGVHRERSGYQFSISISQLLTDHHAFAPGSKLQVLHIVDTTHA